MKCLYIFLARDLFPIYDSEFVICNCFVSCVVIYQMYVIQQKKLKQNRGEFIDVRMQH